jgi:hypothetical protein
MSIDFTLQPHESMMAAWKPLPPPISNTAGPA